MRMWNGEVGNFVTCTVTEFLLLHFLLTCHPYFPLLFQRNIFYFHLFPLVLYTARYIFLNVVLVLVIVVAVAVVEAAVGSVVELQR